MIDCVILAGGLNEVLAEPEEIRNKALIKVGEREMIRYVLDIYRQVSEIGRIAVVGPVGDFAFLPDIYAVELVPERESIIQNISAANSHLQTKNPLLISTADIPLLTAGAVLDFLDKCRPFDCDFYYPIVTKESSEQKFPGVKRTYVDLQEGTFSGGNIFLVNPEKIADAVPVVSRFIEYRKKPLKMVTVLGAGLVWRAVTGKLSIADAEKRFSELLNVKPRAIITDYAEIAFDVDKESDLALAQQIMS